MELKRIVNNFQLKLGIANNNPLRKGKNGNFIFIHINKTGGTSVGKRIGLPKKRHLTVREVIDAVGEQAFYQAFVFTVVRNPWSKVVSHYNYRSRRNKVMLDHPISFRDWIHCCYGENKDDRYYDTPIKFAPQCDWLRDYNEQIPEIHILKQESLERDFRKVAEVIGVNPVLPHLNRTKTTHYSTFYDEETRNIIGESFKEDIERFGYQFEIS